MAQSKQDERMAFRCVQESSADDQAERFFVLLYFYADSSFELIEEKTGKVCARRDHTSVPRSGFYIGAGLHILGRQLKITAYADAVTKQLCEEMNERTAVVIEESAFPSLGRCMSILAEECGLTIVDVQMAWVKREMAETYQLPFVSSITGNGTRIVLAECVREGALERGRVFAERMKGAYAATSIEEAARWVELLRKSAKKPLCVYGEENSSMVILKPALVAGSGAGHAIQQLVDLGIEPTAFNQRLMSAREAHDFLAPYRGVLPDLEGTAEGFVGRVWVLQFVSLDDSVNVVDAIRLACGPFDPVVGKKLFPNSIRARFGSSSTKNAIHCCDLDGEGPVYTNYFFGKQALQ